VVDIIGPAHGVGRRQWSDLAAYAAKVDLVDIAKKTVGALKNGATSSEKFQAVFAACANVQNRGKRSTGRVQTTEIKDRGGAPVGTLTVDSKGIAIKVARKVNPEFGQWLEEHAEAKLLQLFDQWQDERGSGS
jgi:ParB family chromosome partitioning protein